MKNAAVEELVLTGVVEAGPGFDDELELPFEARQKARQRVRLKSGAMVGLKLPRGTILRSGDVLGGADALRVLVTAAAENVSIVRSADARTLARAAYHLGNRHVWVEIGDGYLAYLHDHVLDEMLVHFDIHVEVELAPFEPEAGAYAHGAHGHAH